MKQNERVCSPSPQISMSCFPVELGDGNLAAQRRRRLFPSAVPGAERTEDVVKPDNARVEPVILAVMQAEALGDELLPSVGVLRRGGVGLLFTQRHNLGFGLAVLRVDAGGRGVEIAGGAIPARRFERMRVDQHIIVQNLGVMLGDEPHAAHVGRQRVDVVDAARRLEAVSPAPEVQQFELVGVGRADTRGT